MICGFAVSRIPKERASKTVLARRPALTLRVHEQGGMNVKKIKNAETSR